jgi:NTE family protein
MGALVGGALAAGKLEDAKGFVLGMTRANLLRYLDPTVRAPGLLRGARIMAVLRELIGDPRIEDLPIGFVAVASDLAARRPVWLTSGSLLLAMRASIAVPVVFTPVMTGGRLLADGGLLTPVPVAAVAGRGMDATIGVSFFGMLADPVVDPIRVDADTVRGKPQQVSSDLVEPLPDRLALGRAGILALDVMQAELARAQLAKLPPDVLIEVPADEGSFADFDRADDFIEQGRRLAAAAFDAAGI